MIRIRNKKELSQFIIDLCGFTLDKAGYHSKAYAFYLLVALRHQAILQKDLWQEICKEVESKKELAEDNTDLYEKITAFAQTMVAEVIEADRDNLAVKLIKTSYLSQLDKALKSSEYAIKVLNAPDNANLDDLSESKIEPSEDTVISDYTAALQAYCDYLDSLLALPFILEKLCIRVVENNGVSYQPGKTAEMLAQALDTIKLGLRDSTTNAMLIGGLKLAIDISLPNAGIDDQLRQAIVRDLLPFIQDLIKKTKTLENKKENIPKHRELLAVIDVQLYSIEDILKQTLLNPVEELSRMASNLAGAGQAIQGVVQNANRIDQAVQVAKVFKQFDKVANGVIQLDLDVLPQWLQQANQYYGQLKAGTSKAADAAQVVLDGLGTFYTYAISFIPKGIQRYLARMDALDTVFRSIDELSPKDFSVKKANAFFSFYDLVHQNNIKGPFKAKFFEAYSLELIKNDQGLKKEALNYNHYLIVERQLNDKIKLKDSLSAGIKGYNAQEIQYPSKSLNLAANALDLSPAKLAIFALCYRLQRLENKYDSNRPNYTFIELIESVEFVEGIKNDTLNAFKAGFMDETIKRLLTRYQNERLRPILEEMLDSKKFVENEDLIRTLYSKLFSENYYLTQQDLDDLKNIPLIKKAELKSELVQIRRLRELIKPHPVLESIKEKPQTPKEQNERNARFYLDKARPFVKDLLDNIRKELRAQGRVCIKLKELAGGQSNVATVCKTKNAYIDKLIALLNEFNRSIMDENSTLCNHIISLLSGKMPDILQNKINEELEKLSLFSIPGQLIQFAWNVIPSASNAHFNEAFINNLFRFFLLADVKKGEEESSLLAVIDAKKTYEQSLNQKPVPALIHTLSDPLTIANIIPGQERLMNNIVDGLIEAGREKAFAWGTDYLSKLVNEITQENLIKYLPYPFLAGVAMQVLQSQVVQAKLAPFLNPIIPMVREQAETLIEAAKTRIYPILGIEIQKTIEFNVYQFVLNPEGASAAVHDSFAIYYLQYREIIRNNPGTRHEEVIKFLFPNVLPVLTDGRTDKEEESIVSEIQNKFESLDILWTGMPNASDAVDPVKEMEQELAFLIQTLNLEDEANKRIIKLSLITRLLLMTLDASAKISDEEKINQLQQQSIEQLNNALEKIKELSKHRLEESGFVSIADNRSQEMLSVLSEPRKLITRMQFNRINLRLTTAKEQVENQIKINEKKLAAHEEAPFLGISLVEWEYNQSKPSRLIFKAVSIFFEFLGFVATWAAIILPIISGAGLLQPLLIAAGLASVVGATATGIGLAVFAAVAFIRFVYKFGREIWNQKEAFQAISNNQNVSLAKRIGLISILTLKCLGTALLKTVFIDYLMAKASTLLAFGPFKRIRDAFRVWPDRNRISKEKELLEVLNRTLIQLQNLAGQQDPDIETIKVMIHNLPSKIKEVKKYLASTSQNDARYLKENYQVSFNKFKSSFKALMVEIESLERLQQAQDNLPEATFDSSVVQQIVKKEVTPVESDLNKQFAIVDLQAYQAALKAQSENIHSKNPQGYLSFIWNWFRQNPAASEELEHSIQMGSQSLSESFIFIDSVTSEHLEENGELTSSYVIIPKPEVDAVIESLMRSIDVNDSSTKVKASENPYSLFTSVKEVESEEQATEPRNRAATVRERNS